MPHPTGVSLMPCEVAISLTACALVWLTSRPLIDEMWPINGMSGCLNWSLVMLSMPPCSLHSVRKILVMILHCSVMAVTRTELESNLQSLVLWSTHVASSGDFQCRVDSEWHPFPSVTAKWCVESCQEWWLCVRFTCQKLFLTLHLVNPLSL